METNNNAVETWEQREARLIKEKAAQLIKGKALVKDVCKLLGFTLEKPNEENIHSVWMTAHKGDMGLVFQTCTYSFNWGKLHVSGSYPKGLEGGYVRPTNYNEAANDEINVSTDKTADQIAKDITRRLLPRVEELTKRVREKVKLEKEYRGTIAENVAMLKGKPATEAETRNQSLNIHEIVGGDAYGEIKVYDNSVNIDVHGLTLKQAQAMLKALKGVKS